MAVKHGTLSLTSIITFNVMDFFSSSKKHLSSLDMEKFVVKFEFRVNQNTYNPKIFQIRVYLVTH